MSEKPEALRIADDLQARMRLYGHSELDAAADAELRKLLAERDRYRDALISCRPAVEFAQRQYVKASLQRPIADPLIDGKSASLSALIDTIDAAAAAKGQG